MSSTIASQSRISQLRNKLNLSQKAFAKRIGITQGALSQLESEKSSLSQNTILRINEEFAVNCNWLVAGMGEIFLDTKPKDIPSAKEAFQSSENYISLVDEEAHAGYISQCDDSEYLSSLGVYKIPGFESGNYRMFEVEGDSMSPSILPREIVVTELVEKHSELENGTSCVLVLEDGIVAKRYYVYDKEPSTIVLKSDNENYKTYTVPSSKIRQIWEIKGKITQVLNNNVVGNERIAAMQEDIKLIKSQITAMAKE